MTKRSFQLGYNLVEIAIVLTVSLMLSSLLVVNYFQIEKVKRDNETAQAIENIKQAIVSYAAKHTAKSYVWVNGDVSGGGRVVSWRLPTGRPYLPCPDVTGDGLEDRRAFLGAATLRVKVVGSELEAGGDCYSNRGMVPWRTLQVPNTDPWGNYYSYRVDANFSNAAVGFDEETRADQGVYTRPLTVRVLSSQTLAIRPLLAANSSVTRSLAGQNFISSNDPSLVCLEAPCSAQATSVLAGEVVSKLVTVQTGGYDAEGVRTVYNTNDILAGVPIVILSHGQNGHGAVRPLQSGRGVSVLGCNRMPRGLHDEAQNSFWNSVCPAPSGAVVGAQNGFVSRPRTDRSEDGVEEFDDIIAWMSSEELIAAMQAQRVLPVDSLPPIGLEAY